MTLCTPLDCSPPSSSVHWVFQARTPEWVAISFSRGSSQLRDQTYVSCVFCIASTFFTLWAIREAQVIKVNIINIGINQNCLLFNKEKQPSVGGIVISITAFQEKSHLPAKTHNLNLTYPASLLWIIMTNIDCFIHLCIHNTSDNALNTAINFKYVILNGIFIYYTRN